MLIFLSSIKVNGEETNYNHAETISNNQKENIFMNNLFFPKDNINPS